MEIMNNDWLYRMGKEVGKIEADGSFARQLRIQVGGYIGDLPWNEQAPAIDHFESGQQYSKQESMK